MKKKRRKKLLPTCIITILIIIIGIIMSLYLYFYPLKNYDIVKKYSKEYNLDPLRVMAIIKAESNFDNKARSIKDAYGLMQITEPTAEWAAEQIGIKWNGPQDLYDEEYNIKMGCWYLNNLYSEFNDWDLVIAAYNGGRGNVNKWLNDKEKSPDGRQLYSVPFPETDKYIKRVKTNYKIYKIMYDKHNNLGEHND